jgi:hypothetical protein
MVGGRSTAPVYQKHEISGEGRNASGRNAARVLAARSQRLGVPYAIRFGYWFVMPGLVPGIHVLTQ